MYLKTCKRLVVAVLIIGMLVFVCYVENYTSRAWWWWCCNRSVAWKPWKHPTYSVQWQRLDASSMQTVAFIVMTSSLTKELYLSQLRTWLRDVPNVWAFSDEYDGLFVHTLPSLYGKNTYSDAQHRQLRGMQWLYRNQEKILGVEWLFLIDDDTWINLPVFSRALSLLDSSSSMLCGYEYESGMFNGGAGILLSRPAYDTITPRLYSDACPFLGVNDNTITECARKSNVTMMHSGMFSFYPAKIDSAVDFIEQISIHPVKEYALMEAMTSTSSNFYAGRVNASFTSQEG
jgi:hypothetical protein